jgi:hypothetical protein
MQAIWPASIFTCSFSFHHPLRDTGRPVRDAKIKSFAKAKAKAAGLLMLQLQTFVSRCTLVE